MTDEYTKGLEQQLEELQGKLALAQAEVAKRKKKKEVDPTNAAIKKLKTRCKRTESMLKNANQELACLTCEYSKVRFLGFEWTRKIN
jgi:peptidoglycan hydrolase CwlO-like protein